MALQMRVEVEISVEVDTETDTLIITKGFHKYKYQLDCAYCMNELNKGRTMFPNHNASRGCKSGGKNHCTCDACF